MPNHSTPSNKLLKVSDFEWDAAHHFFSDPDNAFAIKLRRPREGECGYGFVKHSFLKVDGVIYAIDNKKSTLPNGKYLGEGAYGKISVVQTRNGENFALKVELPILPNIREREVAVMKLMGRFLGATSRKSKKPIRFKDKPPVGQNLKIYTIQKLIIGLDLIDLIRAAELNGAPFTSTQFLIMCAKALEEIHNMHRLNILHNDIKPENFIGIVNGHDITIKVIDFGAARILPEGQSRVFNEMRMGTAEYTAPEALHRYEQSFASDIYSLGRMFHVFAPVYPIVRDSPTMFWMINDMMLLDPLMRPSLASLRLQLNALLEKQDDYVVPLSEHTKNVKLRYEVANEDRAKVAKALADYKNSNFIMKGLRFLCGLGAKALQAQLNKFDAELLVFRNMLLMHAHLVHTCREINEFKATQSKNVAAPVDWYFRTVNFQHGVRLEKARITAALQKALPIETMQSRLQA
jgi:serine/threonine protein kinase